MTIMHIIKVIVYALICGFICGGWYLVGEWIENISFRRWEKKKAKQSEQKKK